MKIRITLTAGSKLEVIQRVQGKTPDVWVENVVSTNDEVYCIDITPHFHLAKAVAEFIRVEAITKFNKIVDHCMLAVRGTNGALLITRRPAESVAPCVDQEPAKPYSQHGG